MRASGIALAILGALLLQTALGLLPAPARVFDPFLLVLVYCALTGGETQGMLAGMAVGWVEDVHFGGQVLGFSAVSKLLIGFAVGMAGAHFVLIGAGARALVLLVATVADALLAQWLAGLFDIRVAQLSPLGLASRATANAVIGVALFELLDRRALRSASK